MTTQEKQQISTGNIEYDLVSVVYHSLQSALSASVYMSDAQSMGDQELSQFFWNNQQENRRAADHAEYLLNKRFSQMQGQSQSQGQQQQGQTGQTGQSQYNQGQFGQGQYGYGWNNPGMYGGGYGWYNPGMGGGMYGGQYGGMGSMYGGGMGGGSGMPTLRQVTGTSDVTYDLISTIYHSLETAQTIQTYMQDVQQTGEQEISQFLQQIHQEANRCAQHAQRLLAPRLSQKRMYQSQFQGGQYSYGGGSSSSQGSQTSGSQSGQTTGSSTSRQTNTGSSGTSSQR